jgi:peptide deformylase
MALLPIYNCFHPILKQKATPVAEFNQDLRDFVENMYETMHYADGVGLAANQVGDGRSILLVDISELSSDDYRHEPITMINPEIISFSDETIEFEEGCLSIPKFYDDVVRPEAIEIKYLDIDMKEHKIEAHAFLSRVIQHEVDHLNGILFFERLSTVRRALSKSKLKRISKGDYEIGYPMILPDGSKMK